EKENRKKILGNLFRGRNSFFIGGAIFVLLLLNLIAWNDQSGFLLIVLYECLGLALITFLLLRDRPFIRIRRIREFDFLKSYLFMQIGLLFITSIVPVIVFFKIAFDQEIILHIRHGEIYYAQKMSELSDKDKTGFIKKEPLGIYSSNELNVYDTTFYDTRVHWGPVGNSKIFRDNSSDTTFEQLLSLIRPAYNTIADEEKNLAPSISSGMFNWGQDDNGLLFLQNSRSDGKTRNRDRDITIVSSPPVYNSLYFSAFSPGRLSTIFVWLAFILFMVILFFFMRFIFSRMFATGFFEGNEFVPTAVEHNIAFIRSKNIFLVGPPSSGKRTWLEKIYGSDIRKSTIDLVNLRSDTDVGNFIKSTEGTTTIVLDHFEYGLNDYELNNRKLSLLISLFGKETHNIIILSAIHPAFFIEEIANTEKIQSEKEKKDDNNKKTADDSGTTSSATDKWISLLGSFYKIYFPLQTMVAVSQNENIPEFILNECKHSPFLIPVQNAMVEFVDSLNKKNLPVSEEEIILQIQSMAHPYYDSLWNSLSKEERYTVFDIAQDGLANTKNREVIIMLLNKGVLVYEDKLKIMNRSFQNFVLSEVNSKTILTVEKNNIPLGNWARIKSPLIIILIAVAIFIFATQQETFNRVIAFITTFAAGLPVILRLISLLSFNSGGKQA
ncbi:MAG TPA: hypothetical protein VFJ43_02865, partial [Bacteroidia bacterium]|nr:hypothetical protein [Bacteroidia bacterium]